MCYTEELIKQYLEILHKYTKTTYRGRGCEYSTC